MGARILVIDDDRTNGALMGYLLRAFGHDPVVALGGEHALDEARNRVPDLVLCDIRMPGMDGFAVLRQLRSDARFANTAVIGVTALAMADDQEKIIAAGFDGYLTKPITPESFVDDMEKYLPASLAAPRMRPLTRVVSEREPSVGANRSGYVLVADGDAPGRALLHQLIVSLGIEVRTASSAEDALALARDSPPRLIISDRLALLEVARADAILKDIPFLLVSDGAPSEEQVRIGRNAGANVSVERPLDAAAMRRLLEVWLPVEMPA